ncbi:MAG: VanW family protein [Oscillospiraceae bacterium]
MFDRARARSEAALSTHTMEAADFLTLDKGYIEDAVNQLGADLESTLTQPTAQVEGSARTLSGYEETGQEQTPIIPENGQTLILRSGQPGRHLDTQALEDRILKAFSQGDLSPISITYDETLREKLNLQEVFQKYCLAPWRTAVLDETTYVASQETLGYGFVVEEVQKQLDSAQPGQELRVPFQILVPEHTKESLEADLFRDVLAYAHTDHTWNSNRTRNLELACEAIDGYILKPGAVFSFNETVGERTAEKGYKAATVYSGMESVQELGGGVCQVASTLYYCTLYADLRWFPGRSTPSVWTMCHMGMDATVYWGSLDYQFRNNTDYPIKINASVHDGYVDIEFIGTDTKDYYVKMDYVVLSKDPWETKEKEITDGSYEDGETITTPYTGYTVDTYKYKYDKETDELISEAFEAHSEYARRDKVVAVVPRPAAPRQRTPQPPIPRDRSTGDRPPTDPPTDPDPEPEPTDPEEDGE